MSESSPAADAPVEEARVGDELASLGASAFEFAQACGALLDAELSLAKASLRSLVLAMIAAPVMLLGLWLSTIMLCVLGLHGLGLGWPGAAAGATAAQLVATWLLFRAARRWARDLTLHRSRALFAAVLKTAK